MYTDYSVSEAVPLAEPEHHGGGFPTVRYIHHRERGSRVLLFVREFKTDRITMVPLSIPISVWQAM